MKKLIIAVCLIGVAVVICAPYANGLIMERVAKKASTDVNQMYSDRGLDITVDILDYKRSFSRSQVKWKIDLGSLHPIYGVKEIIVVDQAQHGYFGVVSKSSLSENRWFSDFINQKLDGKNPLEITTQCNLMGNLKSTVAMDAFSLDNGRDTLEIKPGRLMVGCKKGFTAFSSLGLWQGLEIPNHVVLDHLTFESKFKKHSTYIWEGKGNLKVARCKATAKNAPFEISNLIFDYTMDFEKSDNTLSLGMDYGIDRFAIEDKRIDSAFVHLGINRMAADGYENLVALYTRIIKTTVDGMANPQTDPKKMEAIMQQQMMASGFELVGAVEKVLKTGFEIQVSNLKVTLPEGNITGDLALSLKQDITMAQLAPLIGQPRLALDMISLHSDVSLPASLVGDNPALLSPAYPGMQTGLFEKKGKQMVHKAETKDGKLYLNGQEVILH